MTRQETPEKAARRQIDAALDAAGWKVQGRTAVNLHAGRGVAVREFKLEPGHGYADYLLRVTRSTSLVSPSERQRSAPWNVARCSPGLVNENSSQGTALTFARC